jgi:hypothetical protein
MKIDVFATTCFEYRNDSFYVYDDTEQEQEPARIVTSEEEYNAYVKNEEGRDIYFVPLDKNIPCFREDGNMESLCDALLIACRPEETYDFYLVELKAVRNDWIPDGISQLKQSISKLKESYSLSSLTGKRAYLSNSKHPNFHYSHKEEMQRFRNETGFRLFIEATINIK